MAAGAKQRLSDQQVIITSIIGDVTGRDVIVLDDEIARGTTILELLDRLRERDVRSVRVACTHGLFADGALQRIEAAPEVTEVVCTNTVPIPEQLLGGKLTVISLAPALAEAIRRIHEGESVSVLFARSGHVPGTAGLTSVASRAQASSMARVICSVVSGRSRTRTPTASATALPMAPATGPWASSPAPVSASSRRPRCAPPPRASR